MKYAQGSTFSTIVDYGKSVWAYTDDSASFETIPDNTAEGTATGTIDRTDGTVKFGPFYKPTVVKITATSGELDVRNYEFSVTTQTDNEFNEMMAATNGMTPEEMGGVISRYVPERPYTTDVNTSLTITDTTTGSTTISGASLTNYSSGSFYYGAVEFDTWSNNPSFGVPKNGSLNRTYSVTFMTDADEFEVSLINFSSQFIIVVNDRPVQSTPFQSNASGAYRMIKVSGLSGVSKVEITGFSMPFRGVYVDPAYTITSYRPKTKSVFAIGDSYTQGGGALNPVSTWLYRFSQEIGVRNVFSDGLGGSGWLSSGSRSVDERITTYFSNTTYDPDIFVFALGYNDKGRSVQSIVESAESAINRVKSLYPKTRIAIMSPWTPRGETSDLLDIKNALSDVSDRLGCCFVDISDVVTSDNWDIYMFDANHVNQYGHDEIGLVAASRFLSSQ